MGWPEKLIIATAVLLLGALAVGIGYEVAHPCVRKINCRPVTYYVLVGKILMPQTQEHCDCLERAP